MLRGHETNAEGSREDTGPAGAIIPPPIRLAVGLGDPERERELLPALGESGEFVVAERCLAAEQLLACLERGRVDVALVASDLHRLSTGILGNLARTGVPLVLLAAADERPWQHLPVIVAPLGADAETIRQMLLAAMRGERPVPVSPGGGAEAPACEPEGAARVPGGALSILAIASGHGSPGRTTVALGLATALGAVAPTVLVDADLSGPSLAACLDADPTRNLYMLAHAEPETSREWERAIGQETQPLGPRSPHGVVLCGVPKPEMRAGVSTRFFERLLAELGERYRYVVLDVGADLLGAEAAVHRTALGASHRALLVASPDLVGLWHARTALGVLKDQLQIGPEGVALIVNGHDRRYHHGRAEIEWALGVPTAAVIPHDHAGAQRALAAQQALVLDGRSRAARSLLDLAERLHGGSILLPSEPVGNGRSRWRKWLPAMHLPWSHRNGMAHHAKKGTTDGDYATPVR